MMTQLSVASELPLARPEVLELSERIRGAVEQAQFEAAKRLLLDYAKQFGSEFRDEAVLLASRLAAAVHDQRSHGKDIDAERNRIGEAMLALVRRLESRVPSAPPPPQSHSPQPVGREPASRGAAEPELAQAGALTDLERAKLEFERGKQAHPARGTPAFRCEQLGKRYAGRDEFSLKGVSLTVRPGEIVGLVGDNGSGKTTLLRLAAGELQPTEGALEHPALGVSKPPNWAAIRPQIAYVEQMTASWPGRLRPMLQLVAAQSGHVGEQNAKEVDFWIHRLGLERFANATWSQISGGYKMRFELARALISKPKLLILDEPLAPLDVIAQRVFLQDLRDLAASPSAPLAMLVSSQHLYEIELVAHQLLFLRNGYPAYCGPPSDFRSKEAGNLFELACNFTRGDLLDALHVLDEATVQEFGKRFLVRTPSAVSAAALLSTVTSLGARVEYFHDLTHSTRRLFEEELRHD